MAEEMGNEGMNTPENVTSSNFEDIDTMDFLLFLILILLLLGNQNTFNSYFQLFDKEINELNNILSAFKTTAEGLKSVFSTSSSL